MKIRLPIIERDIQSARRLDGANCPIARSLTRHGLLGAYVGGYDASAFSPVDLGVLRFRLCPDAAGFVHDYDFFAMAEPCVVTLEVPE